MEPLEVLRKLATQEIPHQKSRVPPIVLIFGRRTAAETAIERKKNIQRYENSSESSFETTTQQQSESNMFVGRSMGLEGKRIKACESGYGIETSVEVSTP
jgi:hypothetical protein